jgi:hypothetical protein
MYSRRDLRLYWRRTQRPKPFLPTHAKTFNTYWRALLTCSKEQQETQHTRGPVLFVRTPLNLDFAASLRVRVK